MEVTTKFYSRFTATNENIAYKLGQFADHKKEKDQIWNTCKQQRTLGDSLRWNTRFFALITNHPNGKF